MMVVGIAGREINDVSGDSIFWDLQVTGNLNARYVCRLSSTVCRDLESNEVRKCDQHGR